MPKVIKTQEEYLKDKIIALLGEPVSAVEETELVNQSDRENLTGAHPYNDKYKASIKYDGKSIHLGVFDTESEAHEAYKKSYKVLHGEEWKPFTLDNKIAKLERMVEKKLAERKANDESA